jgi:hypothetical protein
MAALGSKGVKISGAWRMENLSDRKRKEIAKKAAAARWAKKARQADSTRATGTGPTSKPSKRPSVPMSTTPCWLNFTGTKLGMTQNCATARPSLSARFLTSSRVVESESKTAA